ncbi:hypothetical protein [Streptomyces aurantiogriseus]
MQADNTLDPAHAPAPPQPPTSNDQAERRSRIAQAAAVRPSRISALATAPSTAAPRTVGAADAQRGRGR